MLRSCASEPRGVSVAFAQASCPWNRGYRERVIHSRSVCMSLKSPNVPPSSSRRATIALLALNGLGVLAGPRKAFCASSGSSSFESVYDVSVVKNDEALALEFLRGKVTLFVNVASYCALTPQYSGLVALHDELAPRGFEIVASPCDQFGRQEPGSNRDICAFAKEKFSAKFLLLDKLQVNDAPGGVAPLYKFLKSTSPDYTSQRVSWNFEKFLVSADGRVLRRYKPGVLPEKIRADILFALEQPKEDLPQRPKPYLGVE